jgi:hypothetical protein
MRSASDSCLRLYRRMPNCAPALRIFITSSRCSGLRSPSDDPAALAPICTICCWAMRSAPWCARAWEISWPMTVASPALVWQTGRMSV